MTPFMAYFYGAIVFTILRQISTWFSDESVTLFLSFLGLVLVFGGFGYIISRWLETLLRSPEGWFQKTVTVYKRTHPKRGVAGSSTFRHKGKKQEEKLSRPSDSLIPFGVFMCAIFLIVWILLCAMARGAPQGCDESILLETVDETNAEKDLTPHETLKGFDRIDTIKAELEEACPGILSCADALYLVHSLHTGRRNGTDSFADVAIHELPSPHEHLSKTIVSFASRGFSERETANLIGADSIGVIHCKFIENCLYNFGGTDGPDLSLDTDFLNLMRSRCRNSYSHSPSSSPASSAHCFDGSPSSSPKESGMEMNYEEPGSSFGTLYYCSLLQGRCILYADQQLMAGEETGSVVRANTSDGALFCQYFALTMMKLSNLRVLTAPMGQVLINCSRFA